MLKFLRKYDKWILAVGGSLLMVAFLLPQALQQLGRPGPNRVVAEFAGGTITAQERIEANRQMQFVDTLTDGLAGRQGITDPDHWVMLREQASRAGLVGGPEAGRQFFVTGFPAQAQMDPMEALRFVASSSGMSEETALRSLAAYRGIERLLLTHLQAPRYSRPELVRAYARTLQTVGLHAGLVRAESMLGAVSEFPPSEYLASFYEEHKDRERGAGKLDFGYRQPKAVKFEWIDISPQRIQQAVPIDPVAVNARWRQNRDLYPGEFAEERQAVEEDMRLQKGTELLGSIETLIKAELAKAERGGAAVDLERLAFEVVQNLSRREGFSLPEIRYDGRDEKWYTQTEVRAAPRIRNARMQSGGDAAAFPQLAFEIDELDPGNPHGVGVGDVIGPMRSNAGSVIYARVTDARPEGPPESLEAVRDQVVADYRMNEAWETLRERSGRYPQQIAARGIAELTTNAGGEFVAGIRASREALSPPVTREVDGSVLEALDKEAFRERAYDVASRFEPVGDVRGRPAENRVFVVELPAEAMIGMGEIISVDPVTENLYFNGGARQALMREISRDRQRFVEESPFAFETMKSRLAYRRVGGEEEQPPAGEGAEDASGDGEEQTASVGG